MPRTHVEQVETVTECTRQAATQVAARGDVIDAMGVLVRGSQIWLLGPNPALPRNRVVPNLGAVLMHGASLLDADAAGFAQDSWRTTNEVNPATNLPWTDAEIASTIAYDAEAFENKLITESLRTYTVTRNSDVTRSIWDYNRHDASVLEWGARRDFPMDVDQTPPNDFSRHIRNIMYAPTVLQNTMRKDVRLVGEYDQAANDQQMLQLIDSYGFLVDTASDI